MPIPAKQWRARVAKLSAQAFQPEPEAVAAILAQAQRMPILEADVLRDATVLVEQLRARGAGHGVEAFLAEYGLGTDEGAAVMGLAEALLRIPDVATAQALIRDKFNERDWRAHLGHANSAMVNMASWGLLLGARITEAAQESPWASAQRLAKKLGEPALRQTLAAAMRQIGRQFVLGETIEDALDNGVPRRREGYRFSYDILGEGARNQAQAHAYLMAYREAIPKIGTSAVGVQGFARPGISVKLSGLHARYHLSQEARVMAELYPRLLEVLVLARQNNLSVAIDAEEANRLDLSLLIIHRLAHEPALEGWNGLGFVVQAYGKRALGVIQLLGDLAQTTGRRMPVRLVKGAYWDSEIKHAQTQGLEDYPVYTRKAHTDASYLACAELLLAQPTRFYPQFGTHNARTAESIMALAKAYGISRHDFEFQRLHGMGEALHTALKARAEVRIYAPIGAHRDLLAYLIRRLLENGAGSSFVHLLFDSATPLETLLADPLAAARASQGMPHPNLPKPSVIYTDWRNSRGHDLGYLATRDQLLAAMQQAAPILSAYTAPTAAAGAVLLQPHVWAPLEERAAVLEKTAELLEHALPSLVSLMVEEAGKTLPDGISEVREAADYCRYYAHQARRQMPPRPLPGPTGEHNALLLEPRGMFGCISPWNFPLAIFLGQVAAALVTGNRVLAKPAEQTPRIAQAAVALLRQAGLSDHALQLVLGTGEVAGAALVAEPTLAGLAFTGSDATARLIARQLAAKDGPLVPFIAETGGINAMVVDSSALLEAACDDVLASAFGSAGQRCSALRLLFLQDEIGDAFEALLAGAMQELRLGDPVDPTTDIGPIIDHEAEAMLNQHLARLQREARLIARTPRPESLPPRAYVAPHAFALKDASELNQEIFGPVLHVVRFKAGDHGSVVRAINAKGYGLTFGIHSRIQSTIDFFLAHVAAGNAYINRSMIGATVGVQPFGGEGRSGTGPKAGGPHYLPRFCVERVRSTNSAAIGGNLALLDSAGL